MPHKFVVGQIVDLLHRPLRAAAAGEYEIRHLMPAASDGHSEDPSYRIKSTDEKHERVVGESELVLSARQHDVFSFADDAAIASASLAQASKSPRPSTPSPVQILAIRSRITRKLAASRTPPPGRLH